MANKESSVYFDTVLIYDINTALTGCQMSARGFFFALLPLLEAPAAYGCIDMNTDQLAHHFKLSLHHIRRYLHELKREDVLREATDGMLVCPFLIRKRYKIGVDA
jgi:hypothetical protein